MKRWRVLMIASLMLLLVAALAEAQNQDSKSADPVLFSWVCTDLKGSTVAAPDWQTTPDGMSNQQVLLKFRGDWKVAEASWTIGTGVPYYEAAGIGTSMQSGFAIMVTAEEYVETYVYNAGTTELLFTVTRSGSRLLPNSMKAFRGRCKPAGELAR